MHKHFYYFLYKEKEKPNQVFYKQEVNETVTATVKL